MFVLLLHLVGTVGRGKVPKVDVKHVKCYLPYLLGSMNIHEAQSRYQPPASHAESSFHSHQMGLILRALRSFPAVFVAPQSIIIPIIYYYTTHWFIVISFVIKTWLHVVKLTVFIQNAYTH